MAVTYKIQLLLWLLFDLHPPLSCYWITFSGKINAKALSLLKIRHFSISPLFSLEKAI